MFDVLIIGGGAAGLSCALVIGSAKEKQIRITQSNQVTNAAICCHTL